MGEQLVIAESAIPQHVAVIMDGNGRWAKKRGWPRIAGHREARRCHLVLNRAHRPIRSLGLQQMLDQPARGIQTRCRTLLLQVAPSACHAVQAQCLELNEHVTHDPPPGRAGCRSALCSPVVAL